MAKRNYSHSFSMELILIVVVLLPLSSCNSKHGPIKRQDVVQEFLSLIKNRKYDEAKYMIYKNPYTANSYPLLVSNIGRSTEILVKYGVPLQDKWTIEYDTAGIVKIETFVIPIFKGFDSVSNLEEASARISFDYTGSFIGDSIYSYQLNARKRLPLNYIYGK